MSYKDLSKKQLEKLLELALETGATFSEIFFEDSISQTLGVISGKLTNVSLNTNYGAGIRILKGIEQVYSYTNEITYENLEKIILDIRTRFNENKTMEIVKLGDAKPYKVLAKKPLGTVSTKIKSKKISDLSNKITAYDPRIVQSAVNLSEVKQNILVVNSKGTYQDDLRTYTRLALTAVAKEGDDLQRVFEAPGKFCGYELTDMINFDEIAIDVAKRAVLMLSAQPIKAQVMPVIIANGWGGVIFHEAVGHPLEATAVAKGTSPFCGKIGQQVASECVSARDNGTLVGEWGYLNFDDEGNETQNNLLIENGILKSYLVDYRNSLRMEHSPTGSARRQSYKYAPTSRMNTTFIDNGKDTVEDIIKDTKFGFYARSFSGGQVNPATGEYNFGVSEGYMIEDGKITIPVKGAMLIGYGDKTLALIDRVADDLAYGQGMCGSVSGSIPVDVGQPTIRVKEITVGGSAQ